jgi:pimeloyl-ACP methyl ester carboxylesterase
MQTQTGLAEVNGTQLYYEAAGEGAPVVLVHGFSLDHRMWDDQFEAFAQQLQVIRYDLRGFGRSALPDGGAYAHQDDLKGLLDHLGLSQAHLVGLSLGGAIAIDFALAYPTRVRSLVLVDAVLRGFQWSPEQSALDGAIWKTAARSGIAAAKAQWLGHPLFAPAQANAHAAPHLTRIVGDYSGWHFVNDDHQRHEDPPASQRLEEMTAPTLIVVGERDLPDFRRIAELLLQIPKAHKVVLPLAGHMSNMEAPGQFSDIVLEFLAKVPPDQSGPAVA